MLRSASSMVMNFGSETLGTSEPSPPPSPRCCAHTGRSRGDPLPLRTHPDPYAPMVARISPVSCRFTGTGRETNYPDPTGPALWLEVTHDYGYTGWVSAYLLRGAR